MLHKIDLRIALKELRLALSTVIKENCQELNRLEEDKTF